MSVYAVASVLCALAPNVLALTGLRFVQGLAGAGGVVIARAVVRDLHSGAAAVRLFSSLMLVTGLAPILAPLAGGQVLNHTSWRGIFWVLTVLSALIALLVTFGLRETLPNARRSSSGLAETLRTMRALLRDRWFVGHGLAGGLGFGALFAYISGSSFVLQGIYGVSPQLYSVLFAMNGLGLIAGSQVNARLVGRFGPACLLRAGLVAIAVSASALLVVVLGRRPRGGGGARADVRHRVELGVRAPNSTALALNDHAAVAGTASALLGMGQFVIGAAVAPLVGAAGTESAVPMAAIMTVVALAALACAPALREAARMTLVTVAAFYGAGGVARRARARRAAGRPVPRPPATCRIRRSAATRRRGSPSSPRWPCRGARRRAWRSRTCCRTRRAGASSSARCTPGARPAAASSSAARASPSCATHPRALHVLLDGPKAARITQAMAIEGIDRAEAERRLNRADRFRRAYLEDLYGRQRARARRVPHDARLHRAVARRLRRPHRPRCRNSSSTALTSSGRSCWTQWPQSAITVPSAGIHSRVLSRSPVMKIDGTRRARRTRRGPPSRGGSCGSGSAGRRNRCARRWRRWRRSPRPSRERRVGQVHRVPEPARACRR